MDSLETEIISAFNSGNFLQLVFEKSEGGSENRRILTETLINLHNNGSIDLVAGFSTLRNNDNSGTDFFLTRHIFEKALAKLNAPVQAVMDCVWHLVKEAEQDIAAGWTLEPYIEFCAADPSRSKEAISLIESSVDQYVNLLVATLVAGSRIDPDLYFNEVLRLSQHENLSIRRGAILSLDEIEYPADTNKFETAFATLKSAADHETDDQLLSCLILSAFKLYIHRMEMAESIVALIDTALSKGDDFSLHAASKLIGYNQNDFPEGLLDRLLFHLLRIKPTSKRTIDFIDYGLRHLISKNESGKAITFLESLLMANPKEISLDMFDSVTNELKKNTHGVFNRLVTKWFQNGSRVLCEGIAEVVRKTYDEDIIAEIYQDYLTAKDRENIEFIARKVIGYLFYSPVTAASIIVSLMVNTSDKVAIYALGALLFDQLLINYPGKVRDYLEKQVDNTQDDAQLAITKAIDDLSEYQNELMSVPKIPELHPAQSQREAYRRYFSRLLAESYKEAESKSILASIFSKSVLLYGKQSINYVFTADGQTKRVTIPLHSHVTEMEFSQIQNIDPIGVDFALRIFRAEKKNNETDN